ncbi:MAG: elongation factor G [Proteobacteria bacterium]|nr:elongation factor G [Pseudomonadota bacterium]
MSDAIEKLRNILMAGHGGCGKTSLSEVMLFIGGSTNRLGSVDDGNSTLDYDEEEVKRKISLSTAIHHYFWKNHYVNIIDTPGDQNFFSETKTCMPASDGVIAIMDAVSGLEVRTEQAINFANEFNLPCALFINKMDRERADFTRAFESTTDRIEPKPIMIQLPIGKEDGFNGIVDLVSKKAYQYDASGKATKTEIPSDMLDMVEAERESLVENIAEADDELLERYLEGEPLSQEELISALRKGVINRQFIPVLCGSAKKNIGVDLLANFIVENMPSPVDRGAFPASKGDEEISLAPDPNLPFAAFVFKTIIDPYAGQLSIFRIVSGKLGKDGTFLNATKDAKERFTQLLCIEGKDQKTITEAGPGSIVAFTKLKNTATGDTICDEGNPVQFKCASPLSPVISFAITAKTKKDEDKLFSSLSKLIEEDPSLTISRNTETKETVLSGRGQVHIEATIGKLKRKFNVEVDYKVPKVPYKETIKKKVRVQGKHKKQSGGHGQYGDCWVQMEPMPRGKGFEFVDAVVGGVIPRQYIPAVEKGVIESSQKGVLAGFPTVDFKVTLDDGSYHAVDSSEMAFKVAGSLAFKKAVLEANPILLEPIMKLTIITPDDYMGDIMGDMNSRRGRVLGMDSEGRMQIIKAQVPLSEILMYAADLISMTGSRGEFSMEFSHYDEVPSDLAQKVIASVKQDDE